jgi:lysophospholipase L1-like esterase
MSLERWGELHRTLKARAARGGVDLLFIGDSITEGWPLEGKAAWDRRWAPLKAAAFGIGGDQTQHVLWRFRQGEFDGLNPRAVVLLIGTNNFGHQEDSPAEVHSGQRAIVGEIRRRWPEARLLLHGILPCGETPADPRRAKIAACNSDLKALAGAVGAAYVEADALFVDGQGRLDPTLMPDALHPNAEAYSRWADHLKPFVEALLTA